MALFRSFDFMTAGLVLIAAEVAVVVASSRVAESGGVSVIVLALLVASIISSGASVAWNLALRTVNESGGQGSVFVTSLGANILITGIIGLSRGPGLRQPPSLAGISLGMGIPLPSLFMITCGTMALGVFLAWTRSRTGFAVTLIAQNRRFAEEIGIERASLLKISGLVSGSLAAVAGVYLAFSNGSTPQAGMPVFLYGAGGALLLPSLTWSACLIGGSIMACIYVAAQLFFSPSVANTILFALVFLVLLWRKSSRLLQEVR